MMRFKLLWEKSDKAIEVFKGFKDNGWRYHGAKVVRLKELEIIDKATGELVKPVYSVECVGSMFSFLRHKLRSPRGVFMGWDTPSK